jgi:putative transposase
MTDSNVFQLSQPGTLSDPLTEVLRSGARALLAQAVAAEVAGFLEGHADKLTDDGRQRLVRHGHLPERQIMTGIGAVAVRAFVTGSARARSALPSAPRSCRPTRAARKAWRC